MRQEIKMKIKLHWIIITLMAAYVFALKGLANPIEDLAREVGERIETFHREVMDQMAYQNHVKDVRIQHLLEEVFTELRLEKQYPFYVLSGSNYDIITGRPDSIGMCDMRSNAIYLKYEYAKDTDDLGVKATMVHEILHCYSNTPHIVKKVSMPQFLEDGEVYNYDTTFDGVDMVSYGNDKCPATAMYPNATYDKVCAPLMYGIWLDHARKVLKDAGRID